MARPGQCSQHQPRKHGLVGPRGHNDLWWRAARAIERCLFSSNADGSRRDDQDLSRLGVLTPRSFSGTCFLRLEARSPRCLARRRARAPSAAAASAALTVVPPASTVAASESRRASRSPCLGLVLCAACAAIPILCGRQAYLNPPGITQSPDVGARIASRSGQQKARAAAGMQEPAWRGPRHRPRNVARSLAGCPAMTSAPCKPFARLRRLWSASGPAGLSRLPSAVHSGRRSARLPAHGVAASPRKIAPRVRVQRERSRTAEVAPGTRTTRTVRSRGGAVSAVAEDKLRELNAAGLAAVEAGEKSRQTTAGGCADCGEA